MALFWPRFRKFVLIPKDPIGFVPKIFFSPLPWPASGRGNLVGLASPPDREDGRMSKLRDQSFAPPRKDDSLTNITGPNPTTKGPLESIQ